MNLKKQQVNHRWTQMDTDSAGRALLICILLALATLAVYWPARHFEFLNYDDREGIVSNVAVRTGLSWHNLAWAFQNPLLGNWQPLTSLSHMLDCQLFGLKAGGHHLTSVWFHVANGILLFLVLRRLTGAEWRSAFVAGLFALHPLHVESVAWVSERKDVLSTFFFLLTLWSYARFVAGRKKGIQYSVFSVQCRTDVVWYLVALGFFACGLMSKPMLVTLPFVLLLLDYWPLRRLELNTEHWKLNTLWPLLREKLPFLALALVASGITLLTQSRSRAVVTFADWPLAERVANALVAYVRYLGKMFWPQGLVAYYPRVLGGPVWPVAGAAILLAALTVVLLRLGRRWPYVAVGWLWFLGILVPVIGLVQVGSQALADRYTYIPLIGLFILLAWGIADLWAAWRLPKSILAPLALAALAGCLALSRSQVLYWRDSVTLFSHVLDVIPGVALAHNNIGAALHDRGDDQEAIAHLQTALQIRPEYVDAHNNLGLALGKLGRNPEAIEQFEAVLKQGPDAKAYYNLGVLLFNEGKLDRARECFVAAIVLQPDSAEAHNNLGNVLASQGKPEAAGAEFAAAVRYAPDLAEAQLNLAQFQMNQGANDQAIERFAAALRAKPDFAEGHLALARLLEQDGKLTEAAEHYAAAVKLQPTLAEAHNNLSNLAARQKNADLALTHGRAAVALQPDSPEARFNLGNALFLKNQPTDAITQLSEALRLRTNYFEAHQNLGFILEKQGRDKEAADQYAELVRLRPDFAAAFNRLAVVLAKQGRFDEAVKAAETGIPLAASSGQNGLTEQLKTQAQNYRAGRLTLPDKKQP